MVNLILQKIELVVQIAVPFLQGRVLLQQRLGNFVVFWVAAASVFDDSNGVFGFHKSHLDVFRRQGKSPACGSKGRQIGSSCVIVAVSVGGSSSSSCFLTHQTFQQVRESQPVLPGALVRVLGGNDQDRHVRLPLGQNRQNTRRGQKGRQGQRIGVFRIVRRRIVGIDMSIRSRWKWRTRRIIITSRRSCGSRSIATHDGWRWQRNHCRLRRR